MVRVCVPYPAANATLLAACNEAVSLANTTTVAFECVLGGEEDGDCAALVQSGGAELAVLNGAFASRGLNHARVSLKLSLLSLQQLYGTNVSTIDALCLSR